MAIGLELRSRGHVVTLATNNLYRPKIEQAGLRFAPMGPHFDTTDSEMLRRLLSRRKGAEYLICKMMYPSIPSAYEEVLAALRDADLIVTHPIAFAAQIAAEKTGLPWVSIVTAPATFFSRFDPSVIAPYIFLVKLRRLGPAVNGLILMLGRAVTKRWMAPVTRFRISQGLSPGQNPVFEGQHSPQCVLAIFSRVLAKPQPDWPPQTRITGFPFYDQAEHGQGLDPDLERFLEGGPPPVVFTLGSAAVFQAGNFYPESLAAVRMLGCRAVLLAGNNEFRGPLPAGTAVFPYVPFSKIFPRASVVVHSAGIGTCGQALAAGRPLLAMPFGFDQPDNAARLERLGVARVISPRKYAARRVAAELDRLRSDPAYASRAAEVARLVREEDGIRSACDAIENHLASRPSGSPSSVSEKGSVRGGGDSDTNKDPCGGFPLSRE
jgi:UDP:flavonoid glycosyltransferase YjiC (YdhE family)